MPLASSVFFVGWFNRYNCCGRKVKCVKLSPLHLKKKLKERNSQVPENLTPNCHCVVLSVMSYSYCHDCERPPLCVSYSLPAVPPLHQSHGVAAAVTIHRRT